MPTILHIDDDLALAAFVGRELAASGWTTHHAAGWNDAARLLQAVRPDVVLLDLTLPDVDGLEICRRLRADPSSASVAILMVTGRGDESDRVVGLDVGADDYLVKPFSIRELQARVRAVLRRTSRQDSSRQRIGTGDLTIDPVQRRVVHLGTDVPLRAREFDLLMCLAKEPGRVWRRSELLESAWGLERPEEVLTRTVDVHVRRLRVKLGDAGKRIETVKAVGYRFNPDE